MTAVSLPYELVERILSHTGDWELCHALGFSHALPSSSVWQEHATLLDWAILSGSLSKVRKCVECSTSTQDQLYLSSWGSRAMIRFGYVHILAFLYASLQKQLLRSAGSLLPTVASAWGRVDVLQWAKLHHWQWLQDPKPDPINEASRHGQTQALDCMEPLCMTFLSLSPSSFNTANEFQGGKTLACRCIIPRMLSRAPPSSVSSTFSNGGSIPACL